MHFARRDRVVVADPSDRHDGHAGYVADVHLGFLTGLPVVSVILDGHQRDDSERFYAEQLQHEPAAVAA